MLPCLRPPSTHLTPPLLINIIQLTPQRDHLLPLFPSLAMFTGRPVQVVLSALLLASVLLRPVAEAGPAAACSADCELPTCYCDQTAVPGGLNPADTPQMVLFTFNDPVTSATRKKIIDVFPDKLRNPVTGCPIAITLFVVGSGTYVTRAPIGALCM